jgi:serine/threonine-protein kinase HipA
MAVLKRNFEVELAPAYDVAPMVLDPEGIAASTHWPSRLLDSFRNPDYGKIVAEYADEPESAALSLIGALERLVDLRAGLQKHEAPVVMLDHPAIRMREPERVIENLRHRFAG